MDMTKCAALTMGGIQCSRNPIAGDIYCKQHVGFHDRDYVCGLCEKFDCATSRISSGVASRRQSPVSLRRRSSLGGYEEYLPSGDLDLSGLGETMYRKEEIQNQEEPRKQLGLSALFGGSRGGSRAEQMRLQSQRDYEAMQAAKEAEAERRAKEAEERAKEEQNLNPLQSELRKKLEKRKAAQAAAQAAALSAGGAAQFTFPFYFQSGQKKKTSVQKKKKMSGQKKKTSVQKKKKMSGQKKKMSGQKKKTSVQKKKKMSGKKH